MGKCSTGRRNGFDLVLGSLNVLKEGTLEMPLIIYTGTHHIHTHKAIKRSPPQPFWVAGMGVA